MATILLAWELGAGLSHAHRLVRIGRALAKHGHQPILVLSNIVETWALLQDQRLPVFQAPQFHHRPRPAQMSFLASSFADVLAICGWGDSESLLPLVESWGDLLEFLQPAVVVTEYAPTLCLAAYPSTPVVQIGNWFQMPPVHEPTFPVLVAGQAPVKPQDELLKTVQEVQKQRGKPAPTALTDIFSQGDRFPCFFPELDGYQGMRKEPVWDPLEPLPLLATDPSAGFFGYLSAEMVNAEACLTQMALTGCSGNVFLRSASTQLKERLRLQGLTVYDRPMPLGDMLAKAQVIVHHAGSTTANLAVAAGRPQILFPQHLEQSITAQRLARMGLGISLMADAAPPMAGRALEQMLADRRYTDNARSWGQRLQKRPRLDPIPAIIDCCLKRANE